MMENVTIEGKYDDGTKIIFKFLFKKKKSSIMVSNLNNIIMGSMLNPDYYCQQHYICIL
jgi:hypothetical protein